jgi:AraC-like DNA-binding protein
MAARHGISARYLRALFADQGTGFSDHVALRRLMRVRHQLCDPAQAGTPISRIALDAGFGDISAFNHRFRQVFATTPSGMRAAALARWREGSGSV